MKDKDAQKIIASIIEDTKENGISQDTTVEKLKALRPYAVEEKRPVVAKALRLAFEHIEENDGFIIPIPSDEPIDEDEESENQMVIGEDSLIYLINLIKNSSNPLNLQEIREYNSLMEI